MTDARANVDRNRRSIEHQNVRSMLPYAVELYGARLGAWLTNFETMRVPAAPIDVAPDGTDVRPLLQLAGGSFAHFELAPGKTSQAVRHRTVEEIWFFLNGRGQMWRRQASREEIVDVGPGVCLTIPLGASFQFRSFGYEPLTAVVTTMPPWPGGDEAYPVEGKWPSTVGKP